MGLVRASVCTLLLTLPAFTIGACSGDDGGSSSGPDCHCEWGDTCEELTADCSTTECESNGANAKGKGACSQADVVGSCDCPSESVVIYYRSSFNSDPQEDCEFFCDDGIYAAR